MCESDKNTVSYCEGAVNIPFFSKFVNIEIRLSLSSTQNFGVLYKQIRKIEFDQKNMIYCYFHSIPIDKMSKEFAKTFLLT